MPVKKPTLVDKLEAWQQAYDAIYDHVVRQWSIVSLPNGYTEAVDLTAVKASAITAAASLVGGIQWS